MECKLKNKAIITFVGLAALILLLPGVRHFFVEKWHLRPLYIISLSAALAYFFTPIVRKAALKFGVVDKPDARKVHSEPTPQWGGLAIFAAFAIVILYNFDFSLSLKGVAIGAAIVVAVGLLDDKFGLSAKLRIIFQLIAAGIAIYSGARMSFMPDTWWGDMLEIFLSLLWFIGITNAMNFLDGMDGLCIGLSAINAFFFGAVAIGSKQLFFMFISAALCGACLGFLPYNFRKGKSALIFLGDTGSTFLGFSLAGIALTRTRLGEPSSAIHFAGEALTRVGDSWVYNHNQEVTGRLMRWVRAWNYFLLEDYAASQLEVEAVLEVTLDPEDPDYLSQLLAYIEQL